jgi:serine/threonine-protein kinase
MGTVYLARHEQTGDQTAVKVLAPSLARDHGLIARFMREIDAMRKLKNAHVVELYDHGVDGDLYYYAMEFVAGETLTSCLRREKRLPWRTVIDYSCQICIALKAAHDAGVIHRDLKPSNLLLTADGCLKLTDFGVAQVFAGSKLTITGGIIGTAEYMSPEQAQGGRITKRSDLYSLGAVMYVMLTGRPPFSGKTTLDVIQKHKFGQFDRPRLIVPDMPYWLDEIVCQLMEKESEKRPADAYVVNRRLQEVLRKVELSSGDGTLGDRSTAPSTPTVAEGSLPQARDSGPGPGTLMRDLFRADIEAQAAKGELRRRLESTWVLLALLVLLVAGVGYWVFSGRMTHEDRFQAGVRLLEQDEDSNWRLVRDQYFAPLLELGSREWEEKLEPYMTRIRLRELQADFSGRAGRRPRSKRNGPVGEIERLVARASRQEEDGNLAGAERTLSALSALLSGDPDLEAERRLVDSALADVRGRRVEQPPDRRFLAAALERAGALANAGHTDEAARIWESLIALYADDPQAAAEVERARQALAARSKPAGAAAPSATPLAAPVRAPEPEQRR